MHSANDKRRYFITAPLVGWAHAENDPCGEVLKTTISGAANDDEVSTITTLRLLSYNGGILAQNKLTHWGRVTHICVSRLTIIGSDNGLSPDRRQAIIWTNAGILLIGPLETNFREILIAIEAFSFKKVHLKISSAKWRPFCLGLNVLRIEPWNMSWNMDPFHKEFMNSSLKSYRNPFYHNFDSNHQISGLVQERRNSSALAMEFRLSCTNPFQFCTYNVYTSLTTNGTINRK